MLSQSPFPMPVVLLTAKDKTKTGNITTLIWITVLSGNPFYIGVALKKKRYSYHLIMEHKEFGINVPTVEHLKDTDLCGFLTGRKSDKFNETRFTPIPGKKIDVPMIKECPVRLECKLIEIREYGDHDFIVGEVVHADIEDWVLDEKGRIDFCKMRPIIGNHHQVSYYGTGDLIGEWGISIKGERDV